jgi:hypothetical protein
MHKTIFKLALPGALCLGVIACAVSPYQSQYAGSGYPYPAAGQSYQPSSPGQAVAYAAFTAAEIAVIQQYFTQHPEQLQALNTATAYANSGYYAEQNYGDDNDQGKDEQDHGHGHGHGWKNREGGLPPGIAKNLARGKPLPPGIAAQLQSLPPALVQELPSPPPGYQMFMLDGRILLVDVASQVISDMITNAILGH